MPATCRRRRVYLDDPPPPTADELQLAGEEEATRRCGPWPIVGTRREYLEALIRAAEEAACAAEMEWDVTQRFHEHAAREDRVVLTLHGSLIRAIARRQRAVEIADERESVMRALAGPVWGFA